MCFIEKNGKSLLSYVYDYDQAAYRADNLSLLSNLISQPVDMDIECNSSRDKGDYLYIVLADGRMIVNTTSLPENVNAPSVFETDGKILGVCCLTNDTYILVNRGLRVVLEKIDLDAWVDCQQDINIIPDNNGIEAYYAWQQGDDLYYTTSETPEAGQTIYTIAGDEATPYDVVQTFTPSSQTIIGQNHALTLTKANDQNVELKTTRAVLNGLYQYAGKEVVIWNDNGFQTHQLISDIGEAVLEEAPGNSKIGLPFAASLKSNYIEVGGKTTSIKKRIARATLETENTDALTFNGVTKKKLGSNTYSFYACTGYQRNCQFEITSSFQPIYVKGITLFINFGGYE